MRVYIVIVFLQCICNFVVGLKFFQNQNWENKNNKKDFIFSALKNQILGSLATSCQGVSHAFVHSLHAAPQMLPAAVQSLSGGIMQRLLLFSFIVKGKL